MAHQEELESRVIEMMNSTLQKLGESIVQQSAVSINSIQVSEFSGLPNEDVHQFLREFKLQTLSLSESHKCQALTKSLKGAAFIWAKANIKELLATSDWKGIKTAIVNRYSPFDKTMRYRQKLNQLKFDSKTCTLMAFVETYVTTYQKTFPNQSAHDIIQSIRWELPNNIIKGLNQIDDKWITYDSLSELYSLVERYERNILPFESFDKPSNLDKEEFKKMLNEFRESIMTAIQNKPEHSSNDSKQLAIVKQEQSKYIDSNNNLQQQSQRPNNENVAQAYQDPTETYYAKFGKPHIPCIYCQGNHLIRHCPMIMPDLI